MDYKDRHAGLILFGILEILIGLVQGAMALLMVAGSLVGSAGAGSAAVPLRMMVPMAFLYVALGAAFITLGIGSIMARRWARALILVLSWMWLITGVFSTFAMLAIVPKMFASLPPDQATAKPVMIGCMSVIFGLFFILLPLALVLFYRSPNVKATVEARDPVHRWTDDIPLPLLAFGVWLIGGAIAMMFCGFIYKTFPVGPWLLRGAAVPAMILCLVVVMLFIGVGALKRMKAAWWAALAMFACGAAYTVLFMTRTNFIAWYESMGMPAEPQQLAVMQAMYSGPLFYVWMGVLWTAYIVFLVYLRRYFFDDPLSLPNT